MNYRETVRSFIIENSCRGEAGSLRDDTSLHRSCILDSTGMFKLVGYLEDTFGIRIDEHERTPENLDSLVNIEQFLNRKLNGYSSWERAAKYQQV